MEKTGFADDTPQKVEAILLSQWQSVACESSMLIAFAEIKVALSGGHGKHSKTTQR
jgi:hypothetical protein